MASAPFSDSSERFAAELKAAETRLRAHGLGGRRAFVALARHLADRVGLPRGTWPEGPDAPPGARLHAIPISPDLDFFGLAYERFFTDLFKGQRGQYFTPRPLVELVADLAKIRPGDRVLDPTCGSGGFLVAALARGADVDGIEVDPDLAMLARLNVALHQAKAATVRTADFFRDPPEERWDVVLANPPFSVAIDDPAVLAREGMRGAIGSDALFVDMALRLLRPGGRLAVVLPYSFLVNPGFAAARARAETLAVREAVVSLPEGVFLPFGGTMTRACVVVLRRHPAPAGSMLAAVIREPGYDPKRRSYKPRLPDELVLLRLWARGAGAFARAARVPPTWIPEEAFDRSGIAPGVPTLGVSEAAAVRPPTTERGRGPTSHVDFADVDKATGEVVSAAVRDGDSLPRVDPGEILFGRMRPELNNVALAAVPSPALPAAMSGSGEWIRLLPERDPGFLLLALRSEFARAQVTVTGGQTRPRARVEDIAAMRLPDPGPAAREAIDALVLRAHAERAAWRQALESLAVLYARFGRGEITADELERAVADLARA